jgi:uncharacterized Tic20 family protein
MSAVDGESERRLSVVAHASALLGLILPFGQLLGPYLTRLLAPPEAARVREQTAEALNFQLNMVAVVLLLIVTLLWLRGGWAWFALFLPNLYAFGMALWGASRASRGDAVRYPFVLRVIRPDGREPRRGVRPS